MLKRTGAIGNGRKGKEKFSSTVGELLSGANQIENLRAVAKGVFLYVSKIQILLSNKHVFTFA